MNRYNLSGAKSFNIQENVSKKENSIEKIQIKVDLASESEEDEVRTVSVDIEKPSKHAANKNFLDLIPNIIKNNNNIQITRINSNSKLLNYTVDYSGPESKRSKVEAPMHQEVLQDKSNENFRGVYHSKYVRNQQQVFKNFTLLRNSHQVKIVSSSAGMSSVSCQTEKYPLLSIHNIKNNEKALEFYTGLQTYEKFLHVLKSLGPDAYDLRYYYYDQVVTLSILDQFFMTLILLRQHKSHYEMSILFDVTLKDIKNIFITWVRFMKLEWSNIKFPLSYVSEINSKQVNSNKNNVIFEEKDSDIEIEYVKDTSLNDVDSKHDITVPNRSKSFTKVYKILNGPQNYIESNLMNDIILVCQTLCYFKAKRMSHKE